MQIRPASIGMAAAGVLLAWGAARAGDKLSGDEIRAIVSDNTVQGTMEGTGTYTEFYQGDGTIKADGYTGIWEIEGDKMCFQYGSDPKACWEAAKDGDTIQWIREGEVEGTGKIESGNPNNF